MLLNGVLAGAEMAIVAMRKTRLVELVERGDKRAAAVQRLRDDPERFLATVQVGVTVFSATAAVLGGANFESLIEPYLRRIPLLAPYAPALAFAAVVSGVSYLTIVLGELVPKSLALRSSERYALLMGRPLLLLSYVAHPFVRFLTVSSNVVLRAFGDRTSFTEVRMSLDEVQQVVSTAGSSGALDPETAAIASRAVDFGELTVDKVMVPRTAVVGIQIDASAEEVKRVILEEGHTRMPVYRGSADDVVGYITVKDVLRLAWEGQLLVLRDLIRPAYFVPESMAAVRLLHEMRNRRVQLAIVVDEQGAMAGIVTLEDLVEELVGDISSEHDDPAPSKIERESPDSAVVEANLPVRDVNRELGLDLPDHGPWSTVAGLAMDLADRIPRPGETFTAEDGTAVQIVDASDRRVLRVRLKNVGMKSQATPFSG